MQVTLQWLAATGQTDQTKFWHDTWDLNTKKTKIHLSKRALSSCPPLALHIHGTRGHTFVDCVGEGLIIHLQVGRKKGVGDAR